MPHAEPGGNAVPDEIPQTGRPGRSEPHGSALKNNHLADLRASGLDDETIRLSGIYSECRPEYISGLLGWQYPAKGVGAAMIIPFPSLTGEKTTYSRVKLDKPITHKGAEKPAKYESRIGRANEVYLPPRARAVVKDASVPLLKVEGEKKALAGDQHGHAAIGLVGVWGWVKPQRDDDPPTDEDAPKPLHPDIGAFELNGRRVYIVFDSDSAYKPGVRQAEWELARSLADRGADVRVVRLPAKLGGPKVGLDDYFLTHTDKQFESLLNTAGMPTEPALSFSNVAGRIDKDDPEEVVAVPRSLEEMAAELVGTSDGWPRSVGGSLVVPDAAGGVRPLKNHHELFAFVGRVFDKGGQSRVMWTKAAGAAAPQTFHAYLAAECERFERADPLPHEPPVPGVYYINPSPVPDGKFEALQKFLAFFNPATQEDASLLLAAVLTPFWGGPPGKRPAFLFEADESDPLGGRGVGKSTIAQKIAGLCGGAFDIDASETFSRTRSRLLTPEAGAYRVLLMDNVKTFRLSSADLESLITNPCVNGHRLYHGQAGVPNYYTLYFTLNGASVSRDVAQRIVPVRFARANYRGSWESELDAFTNANRQAIIADIIGTLRSPAGKPPRVSRWGKWEAEVLSRVPFAARCAKLIDERTRHMDADQEDGERIREAWVAILSRSLECTDAHSRRFLLRSLAVAKLIETAMNERYSSNRASAQLASLGVKGFQKSDRQGGRMWMWVGDEYEPEAKPTTPPVVSYDYDREEWSKELIGRREPIPD